MIKRGKIDWINAKVLYVTDPRNSYAALGECYGVSKTAIQKRGTKEGWSKERRDYLAEAERHRITQARQLSNESTESINKRHLLMYKNIQIVANQLISDASDAIAKGYSSKAVGLLAQASRLSIKAMKEERKLLGMTENDTVLAIMKRKETQSYINETNASRIIEAANKAEEILRANGEID